MLIPAETPKITQVQTGITQYFIGYILEEYQYKFNG